MAEATTAQPNTTPAPVAGGNPQLSADIGSIVSLITGLLGTGSQDKIAQTADPWGPNRAQYATQLNQFMANPGSIFSDPAFQAAQNVGAENVARYAGAAGMGNSGNKLADLFSFGQSSGLQFEQQRFNELANLAGVNAGSPVAAAGLQLGNKATQGQNLATGLAGVLPMLLSMLGIGGGGAAGGLASLFRGLFGGGGGGGLPWGAPDQGSFDLSGLDLSGAPGIPGDFGSVEIPGFDFGGGSDIIDFGAPFGP